MSKRIKITSNNLIDFFVCVSWLIYFFCNITLRGRGSWQTISRDLVVLVTVMKVFFIDAINFQTRLRKGYFHVVSVFFLLFFVYVYLSQYWAVAKPPSSDVITTLWRLDIPTVLCLDICFDNKKRCNYLTWLFSISIFIYGAVAIATSPFSTWGTVLFGGVTNIQRNQASLLFVSCFSIMLWIYSAKSNKVAFALSLIFFAMNLITGSRKGIIQAALVVCIFILLQDNSRKRWKYIWLGIVAIAIIAFAFVSSPYLQETYGERLLAIFDDSIDDSSKNHRDSFRLLAYSYWLKNPVWGNGADYFKVINYKYNGIMVYSHCNYAELLCNYGIVGFVLYYVNYLLAILKSLKNKRNLYSKICLSTIIPMIVIEYGQVNYYIACGVYAWIIALILAHNGNRE